MAYHKSNERKYKLKQRYGITEEDYNRMFAEQEGKCAICKTHATELKRGLLIDHNHKTGSVRGLLCDACNKAAGLLKDNTETIRSLLEYIEQAG